MDSTDTLATVGRLAGGLIVVLIVMVISAKLARRVRGQTGNSGLVVIDRIGLTREAHLAVVRAGERTLLLGVSPQGVTMLSRLDGDEITLEAAPAEPPVRAAAVEIVQEADFSDEQDDDQDDQDDQQDDDQQDGAPAPRPAPRALPRARAEFEELAAMAELIERTASMDHVVHAPSSHPEVPAPAPVTDGLNGLDLDGFPDLASALRAAGRTVDADEQDDAPATARTRPASGRRLRPVPTGPPATRAEARRREREVEEDRLLARAREQAAAEAQAVAEARALALAHVRAQEKAQAALLAAQAAAPTPPVSLPPRNPRPGTGPRPEPGPAPKAPAPASAAATARVPQPRAGSGSVLSPSTWRQGIEALRELTVRRG